MRDNNHPALRVVALGEFADPIPPLAPRLAALDVVPLRSAALAQLPESLGNQDILLTELAWLEGLNTDQRDALVRRAAPAAGWVALTHPAARFKDLVTWQRLGVGHFFHEPLDPERLAGLVEDIHDRRAGAPIRAILLDDEESSLAYYGAVLRQAGIEVLAVQDPLLVLESLDAHQPDVLVLDIEMPGCRGPELATIVRQYPAYARLPVIFLTAMESMQDQLLARAAAAEDFLAKPVAPELLLAAVEAHAQRYRALLRGEALCERQQAQSRMGLEQLRQAIDAHAIVSIADEQGRIVHVNDKFCAISGYTREELLGQDHSLVKSGVHAAPFYADLWRTIRGGRVWHGEICNRRKNGALYWVDATIYPVLDGKGAPRQFISIRTDITAGKTAEQVMAENAHRLNATLESTKDGILAVDATGKVLFMNRQFRRMWNMPENLAEAGSDDQLLAHALTQLVDPQGFMQQVESLYRSDQDSEDLIELADGRVFERNSRPLQDGGQMSGRVWSFHDITARRRAEQAAESAKERLRRGQIYANIGTWEWNIVTGELYWTERIAPLFGYPLGDLETSYDNFLAAVHPDDRQAVIDAVGACVERHVPYAIEHRVVWPDGTVRWLLERGAVQRDADGKPLQMIGVVQDIDDRKRAELALAERERQLLEAQTLAHIGNWSANLVTGELLWSDEIYRIFGHEPGSFAPSVSAFHAAVHPDDRTLVHESEKVAQATGRHDVVHRILRPDGSVRHVHELAQMHFDEAGKPLRLTGTVQDVTERVEAERHLHDTEARFAFAVEGAGDGVWDWNIVTGDMPLSGNYEPMLGYERGALVPTVEAWVQSVHPDDLARVQQELHDYLEGISAAYAPELRLRCKDGSYKWILCRGTVVGRDRDGKPIRMIGIHSDISARKRAEEALVAAREAADRANQAKSDFLSSMSHELRTPMNAILGFAQMLEYDSAMTADQQDSVHEIVKAGRHLLELINEVLDLAKIESGGIDLSLEPVALDAAIEECLALMGMLADKRGIRLGHNRLPDAVVRADRTRLKQVLLNLLSNAIKYNRDDGSVRIDVRPQGSDRLRIEVSDTGHGIPADKLAQLFQPFNRLDAENSEIEGTGIGLIITRRLVEMMGGAVDVQSTVGVGSTFWIELPLDTLPGAGTSATGSSAAHAARPAAADRQTVLYIEDNPANLKLVAQILGHVPHIHLLTAHTPDLGIELALARRPALVLLDINMPGMDGYQVLEIFKTEPGLKGTPVVAITANAMPRDIERGRAAGFVDYLTKPLDLEQLLTTVKRCLADGEDRGEGGPRMNP